MARGLASLLVVCAYLECISSVLVLVNNTYKGVVVTIDEDVIEHPYIIPNIKVSGKIRLFFLG